jgi:hypothetical protein
VRNILASDIVVPQTTGIQATDLAAFTERSGPAIKSFIDRLLLHDSIVVPLSEFTTLPLLVGTFGEQSIIDMLEKGILKFSRYQGHWMYGTRGVGLTLINAAPGTYNPDATRYSPVDEALDFTLDTLLGRASDPRLRQAVLDATTLFDAVANSQLVVDTTYKHIIAHGVLNIPLEQFRDVPKYIDHSATGGDWRVNGTLTVLDLVNFNMHQAMAREADCEDNTTRLPASALLNAKIKSEAPAQDANASFAVVRELADIPDIGELVIRDAVTVQKLLRLRETGNAMAFREWVHENCEKDPLGVAKAYADMLGQANIKLSWPARTIRFVLGRVVPVGAGFVIGDPLVGAAFSVALGGLNDWLFKNIIRGHSPKFFIDDLRQLEAPSSR